MASSEIFLLFSSSFLVLLGLVTSDKPHVLCPTLSCNRNGPLIRFPFRIKGLQDEGCGYPGFEISCDDQGRAILHLPHSGDLVVRSINYADQLISLGDPKGCLLNRLLATQSFRSDLASGSSPFLAEMYENFRLANCTRNLPTDWRGTLITRVNCLDGADRMVLVAPTEDLLAKRLFFDYGCYTWTMSAPETLSSRENITEVVQLKWDRPDCRRCEAIGWTCGLNTDDGSSGVKCWHDQELSQRLSRGVKFVIMWIAISPVFFCLLGSACYLSNRANRFHHQSRNGNDSTNLSHSDDAENTQHVVDGATGIDLATLESYPKAQIDDPGQVPRPDDNVCAICLSEYQSKEILRIIPECAHYFHAHCIDQWLKRNASCPLCRNHKASSL